MTDRFINVLILFVKKKISGFFHEEARNMKIRILSEHGLKTDALIFRSVTGGRYRAVEGKPRERLQPVKKNIPVFPEKIV